MKWVNLYPEVNEVSMINWPYQKSNSKQEPCMEKYLKNKSRMEYSIKYYCVKKNTCTIILHKAKKHYELENLLQS